MAAALFSTPCQLGICSVFEAEEWAILKGLQLSWELGFRRVIVKSDAKDVIDILNRKGGAYEGDLVLWQIRSYRRNEWELSFSFIFREGNRVADRLAKRGISTSSFLDACPESFQELIHHDNLGLNSRV